MLFFALTIRRKASDRFRNRDYKHNPRSNKRQPAKRRHHPQPAQPAQAQHIQTAGKKNNTDQHQPAGPFQINRVNYVQRHDPDRQQPERVKQMLMHPGLVHRQHLRRHPRLQPMRPERAEHDHQRRVDAAEDEK